MRTIKFRALRTDGRGWVFGYMVGPDCIAPTCPSVNADLEMVRIAVRRVKPETVGQFTGLTDKNGKEIWEGDVVEISMLKKVVGYSDTYATFTLNCMETGNINVYNINGKSISVTGNIFTK